MLAAIDDDDVPHVPFVFFFDWNKKSSWNQECALHHQWRRWSLGKEVLGWSQETQALHPCWPSFSGWLPCLSLQWLASWGCSKAHRFYEVLHGWEPQVRIWRCAHVLHSMNSRPLGSRNSLQRFLGDLEDYLGFFCQTNTPEVGSAVSPTFWVDKIRS